MESAYRYDAFISYRHLPADKAVAQRIQTLLERFRPPRRLNTEKKRIQRVFRDQSELPTSGDLDSALEDALLGSEFLIVVLSEQTQHSVWCMEEIRRFKAAHGGRIGHILPVLISGEPHESLPEELLYETVEQTAPDGSVQTVRRSVEPLMADVRAGSISGMKRRLNTEVLRLIAPILGVGYDDLYQRQKRRRRKQRRTILAGSIALAVLIAAISLLAWKNSRDALRQTVENYLRRASEYVDTENTDKALTYYAEALALDPENRTAMAGTMLSLQDRAWFVTDGERQNAAPVKQTLCRTEGESLLLSETDGSIQYRVPMPTEENPKLEDDPYAFGLGEPAALILDAQHAALQYAGYLYLYSFPEDGALREPTDTLQVDLAKFSPSVDQLGLSRENELWASSEYGFLAVKDGSSCIVLNLKSGEVIGQKTNYSTVLTHVAFSPDGESYALVYGDRFAVGGSFQSGGFIRIYRSKNSLLLSETPQQSMPLTSAVYSPDGKWILALGAGRFELFDTQSGSSLCAPVTTPPIQTGEILPGGRVCILFNDGTQQTYRGLSFAEDTGSGQPGAETQLKSNRSWALPDGKTLVMEGTTVRLLSADGAELAEMQFKLGFTMVACDPVGAELAVASAGSQSIYRVSFSSDRFTQPEELPLSGYSVVGLFAVSGALIVENDAGNLVMFPSGASEASAVTNSAAEGYVRALAGGDGILAVVRQTAAWADEETIDYDYSYSLELWSMDTGTLLGRPISDSSARPDCFDFRDGVLSFLHDDVTCVLRYAPSADDAKESGKSELSLREDFAAAARKLSCYQFQSQNLLTRQEPGCAEAFPWLQPQSYRVQLTADEEVRLRLENAFSAQGEKAWADAAVQEWSAIVSGENELSEEEQTELFVYCVDRAMELKRTEAISGILKVWSDTAVGILTADEGMANSMRIDGAIGKLISTSVDCDEAVFSLYQKTADRYHSLSESAENVSEMLMPMVGELEYRMQLALLRGAWPGEQAILEQCKADKELYAYVQPALESYVILGERQDAAAAMEAVQSYLDQNGSDELSSQYAQQQFLKTIKALALRGLLPEEQYETARKMVFGE